MFYRPRQKLFLAASDLTNKNKLVIGVVIKRESKAYLIHIVGYHPRVMDTIGKTPVMVTYCTLCTKGHGFSLFVNGKMAFFSLIGMDHFNAIFEEAAACFFQNRL